MAERRMFAKSIVLSDAFLDMPLSARCLYFTLGMFADDDGFVGAPKAIMRQCGASQDDLKVLILKRYVLAFESGVIVIKHWRMNNYLQNDRHKETTYIEELATLTVDDKGAYTEKNPENRAVEPMYTKCIQTVYTDKDSKEKKRKDKDSLGEDISCDFEKITEMFTEICVSLPKIKSLTDKRKKALKTLDSKYSLADIQTVFEKAEKSDFLSGRNGSWPGCNFDWLINPNNFIKVLEGNYDNKGKGNNKGKSLAERIMEA